jgi:hypothetical protein
MSNMSEGTSKFEVYADGACERNPSGIATFGLVIYENGDGRAEVINQVETFQRNLGMVVPVLILLSLAPALIWPSRQAWFLGLGIPASILAPVSAILGSPRLAFLCSCLVGLQGASAQILLVAGTLKAGNLFVVLAYVIACVNATGVIVNLSLREMVGRKEKLRKRRAKRHE